MDILTILKSTDLSNAQKRIRLDKITKKEMIDKLLYLYEENSELEDKRKNLVLDRDELLVNNSNLTNEKDTLQESFDTLKNSYKTQSNLLEEANDDLEEAQKTSKEANDSRFVLAKENILLKEQVQRMEEYFGPIAIDNDQRKADLFTLINSSANLIGNLRTVVNLFDVIQEDVAYNESKRIKKNKEKTEVQK